MNSKQPRQVRGRQIQFHLPDAARSAGFTLVEILIALVVLLAGIVAVAQLFAYSTGTNITMRQTTVATLIATNKMEHLRAIPFESLATGGSLDPDNPVMGFWEYVTVDQGGTVTTDTTTTSAPYLQLWMVTGTNPKSISILIYSERSGLGGRRMELMRASTVVTRRF